MQVNDFLELTWEESEANPLIKPGIASSLIADPTFLPPAETPDGRWHLLHTRCGASITIYHRMV